MAAVDNYSMLEQLVNAYFNPDWPDDYDDEEDVLRGFARTNWRDDAAALISQVDRYIEEHPRGILEAFEADFEPMITIGSDDQEALRWLLWVRNRVSAYLSMCPQRNVENSP